MRGMSTTSFVHSTKRPANVFAVRLPMADSALEPAELAFLRALNELGVRFLVVGVTAASMQGARVATEDVDLWFEDLGDHGKLGDRFDVVLTMSGLADFATEYARSKEMELDGIALRVLPLERVIASKRKANRPKDQAALPALEAALAVAEDESGGPPKQS
jgi:hypothetical protein